MSMSYEGEYYSNGLVFITSIDNFYIINPQFTMESRANQKYFAISAEIP